ncbi:MAG: dTDP-4-dehydrorhamnose reductase [Lachnospiraceae bacterium]|nr:dTDP-4-dehydrorhamnose reductase [Lachnospiraceae bacterium]
MKILVTGVGGQLGHDVMNELAKRGVEGIGTDLAPSYSGIQDGTAVNEMPYRAMDITNESQVQSVFEEIRPDGVIHCAAWTAVDDAEDEDKQELVWNINAQGTKLIAECCKQYDSKMLYLSTDYVFDGTGETPWDPDCQEYDPLNVYGKSKLAGEQAVAQILDKYFIVRIAWVFGVNGGNFIKTMLRVGENHDTLTVVDDQIGTPTYTFDLARLLVDMIDSEKYGYYHATNEGGYISWYDFAVEIFRQAAARGKSCYSPEQLTVNPVTTEQYGVSKAKRPFNSRLEKGKLQQNGFTPLPDWKDALSRYLDCLWN